MYSKRTNQWAEVKFFSILFLAVVLLLFVFAHVGCASTGVTLGETAPSGTLEPVSPKPTPTSTPPSSEVSYLSLYWENTTAPHPERKPWSQQVSRYVDENMETIGAAKDLTYFCPKYQTLDRQKKIKAVAELIASVIYFESSYNPVSWMTETTMGIDPVTGKQVKSQSLMQLSYQDKNWAPWCQFDWEKDKHLSPSDPKATINVPAINLGCGLPILNNQIKKRGVFAAKEGVYWAVLRGGDKYETRQSFCARTGSCGNSTWKTGWCAVTGSTCKFTKVPDIKARTTKNAVGCS